MNLNPDYLVIGKNFSQNSYFVSATGAKQCVAPILINFKRFFFDIIKKIKYKIKLIQMNSLNAGLTAQK